MERFRTIWTTPRASKCGRAYELTVPSGELSQVGYSITRAIPSAAVSPAAAKDYAILSNYVRNMVDDARTVYTC